MRHSLLILAAATALSGCGTIAPVTDMRRGIEPVNVPVVTRQDFAFDATAPGGMLPLAEAARLDGWFQGLDLGYGDRVYVGGASTPEVRGEVARVAGRYGLLVSDGAPVAPGAIPPGAVRVVVSRSRASVPNCPNWAEPSQPNYNNRMHSNFACAVNTNLAAMIANPEDLVHGREGTGVVDVFTATRAVESYRSTAPTGQSGLKDITTKGK